MSVIIFLVTLTAEVLTTIAVIMSIVLPQRRIWPPSRPHFWGQYSMLVLFLVSAGGVILLGLIEWGNFIISSWIRAIVGVPFELAGNALAMWAIVALGAASTAGGESVLVRRGPYRFSRNPQYVGFMLGLVGWALMSDAVWTLIVSLLGLVPLILVPYAEEPWLLERYGTTYAEYKDTVPRFIGLKV